MRSVIELSPERRNSRPRLRLRRGPGASLSLLLVVCLAPAMVRADDAYLAVMQSLGAVAAFEAKFDEKKSIPLLTSEVRSDGRIYYDRRGLLARHTTLPFESVFVLTPFEIVYRDAGAQWTQGIGGSATMRDVARTWLLVMQGQSEVVEELFSTEFQQGGGAGAWLLVLRPKGADLARMVSLLRITGHGNILDSIETEGGGGDRSTLRLIDFRVRSAFSNDERKTLFLGARP